MLRKLFAAAAAFVISWLSLSYMFFPIKLAAPPAEYFTETVTHMVPFKMVITVVFVLLAVFMCEQLNKKRAREAKKEKLQDTEIISVDK